ncbi:MAG: alpha/beta hydrolase [Azospirillaceae bacterium]
MDETAPPAAPQRPAPRPAPATAVPGLHALSLESRDGTPIAVFRTDMAPDRPTIVLALPFGLRHAAAAGFFAAVAGRYNVVTWESRFVLNFDGPSETETITADLHADDLLAVIDSFDLAPADVVGYCSGAGIALVAAAREPRRIGRLTLVCGEFMLPPSACRQSGFQREVAVVLPAAASSRDDAAMLQEKIADGAKPATHEFHDFVALPFSTGEHLYRFGRNYLAYRAVDMLATAATVPHEALVIATRRDEQVPLDNAAIVAGCLPGAGEPVVLDGDHYELCRGNPDITAELDRFLAASGRPAPAGRPA